MVPGEKRYYMGGISWCPVVVAMVKTAVVMVMGCVRREIGIVWEALASGGGVGFGVGVVL